MVISDASTIICLAKAGLLDILKKLYGKIHIPTAVEKEILAGPDIDPAKLILKEGKAKWIEVISLPYELSPLAKWHLGEGEAEAIELARINKNVILLLDNKQGRRYAVQLGIEIKGTIGVLIEAKLNNIIRSLKETLSSMRESGLWIDDKLFIEILREVNEI